VLPFQYLREDDNETRCPTQNTPTLEVPERVLTEKELAQTLRASVSLVRKWRRDRKGPPFVRLGDKIIRYSCADVRAWLAEQARRPSAKALPTLRK
jgi:predicted DNA-binding transcriptional regulator AlpA